MRDYAAQGRKLNLLQNAGWTASEIANGFRCTQGVIEESRKNALKEFAHNQGVTIVQARKRLLNEVR